MVRWSAWLPVLVVRGTAPGKTLLVTAGIHGDEFEEMAAVRQVYEGLNLRGRAGGQPAGVNGP